VALERRPEESCRYSKISYVLIFKVTVRLLVKLIAPFSFIDYTV
jgi:hypothetical protein